MEYRYQITPQSQTK
ncbi:hypothetical protein Bhyg_03042 [Pseudolycoriella hygida]|uniref:Uncharacterized protein n=1 Tax=Pseudolycoriella hygida TaxID=35572 RepID=A0A9Q0NCM9_9DIPT|nr:hypothetical protein Bhyg_03042 [Pseudolycoriella hygida]